MPVFVVTQEAREQSVKEGGTTVTFVIDGIESALKRAQATAGAKDVTAAGGANIIQQFSRLDSSMKYRFASYLSCLVREEDCYSQGRH